MSEQKRMSDSELMIALYRSPDEEGLAGHIAALEAELADGTRERGVLYKAARNEMFRRLAAEWKLAKASALSARRLEALRQIREGITLRLDDCFEIERSAVTIVECALGLQCYKVDCLICGTVGQPCPAAPEDEQ